MSEGIQRKLAAIVFADVVSYSRLMGADEDGTLAALRAHRAELIDPKIAEHGGRIVKTMGDGLLLEFSSVIAAVECVVTVQQGMAARNADVEHNQAIRFRIGVHLGDVIVEGDDIFGDGVNIAARLQEISDVGGVTISGDAHNSVGGRVDAEFSDDGEHKLKNIGRPVQVWRWETAGKATSVPAGESSLSLPDKPSIAVLPFDNMSGDSEQEFLCDGFSEEIITSLTRFRWLSVIARNSTFSFKGEAYDVRTVASELGAGYVVEGSVRRIGDKVRITVQLIDAKKGDHLWAERYDRELNDIFAVQDEIASTISATIVPEIDHAEQIIARRKPPDNLSAWECYQRGNWHINQFSLETALMAKPLFEQAVELDHDFAAAHSGLAYALFQEWMYGNPQNRRDQIGQAHDAARRSVAIDDHDAHAHFVLGRILGRRREYHKSCAECQKAIDLNPSYPHAYFGLGDTLLFLRHFDESLEMLQTAERLSPRDPHRWTFLHHQALGFIGLERYEEAVDVAHRALLSPNASFFPYVPMISALGHLGHDQEARQAIEQLRLVRPNYSCDRQRQQFTDIDAFAEHYIDGLRKAGMREK